MSIRFSVTVPLGTTSDPFLLSQYAPIRSIEDIVVAVVCTTANIIEYTLDPDSDIIADTADWLPWSPGSVTTDTAATLPRAVTAVRCDNTGASDSTFKVSA